MGNVEVIPDFLPSPFELAFREVKTDRLTTATRKHAKAAGLLSWPICCGPRPAAECQHADLVGEAAGSVHTFWRFTRADIFVALVLGMRDDDGWRTQRCSMRE